MVIGACGHQSWCVYVSFGVLLEVSFEKLATVSQGKVAGVLF